ncbi:MAG: hypothetical protein PHT16_03370 [Candidatus Pacebacteria bacterium]|nr:hypothetical protein [Candidatus Paceibacterota bacterium]
MKYKKHIATGALAISLLVSGSSVFASTPRDLGIKNVHSAYQKQNKNKHKTGLRKQNNVAVGVVSNLTASGFTVNVKNLKIKTTSSVDVATNASTVYKKDGISASATDILAGQKVIIVGNLDKTTNILTAKIVKIVTNKKNL